MTQGLPPHAIIRPLTLRDLDKFIEVENVGFTNPDERCTPEKARYRLRVCPELSAGVFVRTYDKGQDEDGEQQPDGKALDPGNDEDYEDIDEEGDRSRNGVLPAGASSCSGERLVAHILATKTDADTLTDESMELPDRDEYDRTKDRSDPRGHKEEGRTICIHSVVVHPDYQGQSIGTILLRDYVQRLTTQHIADKIALIAHDHVAPFYQRLDFQDMGPSDCKFTGGGWRALWLPLSDRDDDEDDEDE